MIRKFNNTDLNAVLDLFDLNTPVYFHPDEKRDLIEYLGENSDTYFVLEDMGVISGVCGYCLEGNGHGRITWTFVNPSSQGKGVGRKLVDYCINEMRKKAIEMFCVWTSNLSFRFYEKFGFVLCEVKRDYWAEGLDLYYMEIK